ncbi:MAG: haloperoxidase, partial [Chitinophagaceae bacterium]
MFFSACTGFGDHAMSRPVEQGSMAYKWSEIILLATANDTERFRPRPTVTSRIIALIWTAVFDAWSRYDDRARPVYMANIDRVPPGQRNTKNKEIAISYAAYRTMLTYFFSDSTMLREKMKEFRMDPDNHTLDPKTPEGIGNLAAKSVIEARLYDGSNQLGTMTGINADFYADYTGYKPLNSADKLIDVNHWQPKYFADGKGGKFAPACLTPHWGKVKPLLLDSANQFRCPPPPAIGSKELEHEVKEVVELQANLSADQKALVEFMRDGPQSVQQAGHWLKFAQDVSVRD